MEVTIGNCERGARPVGGVAADDSGSWWRFYGYSMVVAVVLEVEVAVLRAHRTVEYSGERREGKGRAGLAGWLAGYLHYTHAQKQPMHELGEGCRRKQQ
jgi:hypothetical protein